MMTKTGRNTGRKGAKKGEKRISRALKKTGDKINTSHGGGEQKK